MLVSQVLSIRSSEIRERLNAIAGLKDADVTDEIRSECDGLQVEYRSTELKRRAAITSEDIEAATAATGDGQHVDSEERERRSSCGPRRGSATSCKRP